MPEPYLEIEQALHQSRNRLLEALRGISEEQALHKPDPARWCVRDCIEHLAAAERGMLRRIAKAEPGDPLPDEPARKLRIRETLGDRSRRLTAPDHVQPVGRFGTFTLTLEQFEEARRQTIQFAQEHRNDLASRTVQHPLFGAMTGTEMLMVMAGHVRRHTEQVIEIRTQRP
jgi:uncharacterized damage-inducible protein DinB